MILALAGGVGGAKLVRGLARAMPPERLTVIVNTGDDFSHLGLNVSPDLDTVMYWAAGINDEIRGWGLANETWRCMEALEQLGGPSWFKLGDRDLATHLERTRLLAAGVSLSNVTASLCEKLGIACKVAPMTDDPVNTIVHTDQGELEFQHYFVRLQCEPIVRRIDYLGATVARPSEALLFALREDLEAVVICPSNPFLSVAPILTMPGIRDALRHHRAPVIAVSPIIAGQAVKGPAAKILRELGFPPSAVGIAEYYRGVVDGLVIDNADVDLKRDIESLGTAVSVTNTIMDSDAARTNLAKHVSRFATELRPHA